MTNEEKPITREELNIKIQEYLDNGGTITHIRPTPETPDPKWSFIKENGKGAKEGKRVGNSSENKVIGQIHRKLNNETEKESNDRELNE